MALYFNASMSSTNYKQAVATISLTRKRQPGLKLSHKGRGTQSCTEAPVQKIQKRTRKKPV